ncbi:MAG TPA: TIGR03118 family protein [Rugosimonospora sp.]|nr:TIGR03118 family protein [Rugosimonospora sp.]
MFQRWGLALPAVAVLALLLPAPASAASPAPQFRQVNQVSDQAGQANVTDPDLVNAWGLALTPTSPLWVANNGTNTATVYSGGLTGAPVTKAGLTVHIAGGAPTGQVANDTNGFLVAGAPARFLFASEGGDITAWNTSTGTTAPVVVHTPGAIYKGLALWHTSFGTFLLAVDFHNARIDVFDSMFQNATLPFMFHDSLLPLGYAPFNVLTVGDTVYVTYARQDAAAQDEVDGAGLGFVDRYIQFGALVTRIASRGSLNAPWGLAIAPAGFGDLAGTLLVGNFGDGHVSVFNDRTFAGQLIGADAQPVAIDRLWALLPGTASTGGAGTLWFSAGPDDEQHGLVGQLIPIG